jgi:hypothetical protein
MIRLVALCSIASAIMTCNISAAGGEQGLPTATVAGRTALIQFPVSDWSPTANHDNTWWKGESHIPHIAGRISAPVLASGYEAAW